MRLYLFKRVLSDIEEITDFLELKGCGIGLSRLVNKYDMRHVQRINREVKNPQHLGHKFVQVNTAKLNIK